MSAEPVALRYPHRDLVKFIQYIHHAPLEPEVKAAALKDVLQDPEVAPVSDAMSALLSVASDLGMHDIVRKAALDAFIRGIREGNVTELHTRILADMVTNGYQTDDIRICAFAEALPKILDTNPDTITADQVERLNIASIEFTPPKGILKGLANISMRLLDVPKGKRADVRELCDKITAAHNKRLPPSPAG